MGDTLFPVDDSCTVDLIEEGKHEVELHEDDEEEEPEVVVGSYTVI